MPYGYAGIGHHYGHCIITEDGNPQSGVLLMQMITSVLLFLLCVIASIGSNDNENENDDNYYCTRCVVCNMSLIIHQKSSVMGKLYYKSSMAIFFTSKQYVVVSLFCLGCSSLSSSSVTGVV